MGIPEVSRFSRVECPYMPGSPEMAAAVADAKNFLDMEKTGLVIVQEKVVLDRLAV
jgi:hypothetical protein